MKSNFWNASEAFKLANPNLVKPFKSAVSLHRRAMNKTEAEFSLQLEAQKRSGAILRYEYEGITLRWADMRYTPDFVVFTNVMQLLRQMEAINPNDFATMEWSGIKLIEVKGGHIWSRDIVRFKGARAYWPEFDFEMWQKKNGEWTRLH